MISLWSFWIDWFLSDLFGSLFCSDLNHFYLSIHSESFLFLSSSGLIANISYIIWFLINTLFESYLSLSTLLDWIFKVWFYILYTMNNLLLDFLAICAVFSAIFVITSQNPVLSVLFLICVFVCVSAYLILLGMNFLGLTYLLIYVGAISILFLFVVMIMNLKKELFLLSDSKNLPLALFLSSLFLALILNLFSSYITWHSFWLSFVSSFLKWFDFLNFGVTSNPVYLMNLSSSWSTHFLSFDQIICIGQNLYTTYFIWFLIGSIILLLAIIGPIVITHKIPKI